jgi:protein-L-isoaspartate O-methyltransferase
VYEQCWPRSVPREAFVPEDLAEFAYADTPLPIGDGQTISQPYIVALTIQELGLRGGERVLEVGTGSGYAAALLSRIATAVYTIERVPSLAEGAARAPRLRQRPRHVRRWLPRLAGACPVRRHRGGRRGTQAAARAPVAAGDRLVIPVGPDESSQVLVRITRESETEFREAPLTNVRFVPLIGEQAWSSGADARIVRPPRRPRPSAQLATLMREAAEPIDDIETASVDALVGRIGAARLVLLGEATHGTSEFYRMRARITRELIAHRGFQFVAVEADWASCSHSRPTAYVRPGGQASTALRTSARLSSSGRVVSTTT